METRSLPITFELKAVEGRVIEGYAAAWARDRVNDIIDAKAFDRTLTESPDVAVFVGHDASRLPVGEPIEMRADSHGLFTRTSIYQTGDGDALLEVARKRLSNGRTLGMSIGFRTVKDRWDKAQKARIIEDLDLVEYSFLASPALAANPHAQTTAVKRRARKDTSAGTVITYEDSYEDLSDDLEDAAEELLGVPYVSVVATFPSHVVVAAAGGDDTQFWDIPYTLDADNEPQLGQPTELDQAWVPANAKMRAGLESKPYRVERRDGKYCVVGGSSGSRQFGCHDTRAEATAQMRALYANEPKAAMDAAARNALSDSDYAYIDSDGGRHLPVNDEAHVRAALSRFNQTHFESGDKKRKAARKIASRARALGIDVSADSAVAQAAKGGPLLHDLEDTAFAYIEPGGTLDEDKKTVPRASRHVPHHNEDGSLNVDAVKAFVLKPDEHGFAHMLGHAHARGLFGLKATPGYDEAFGSGAAGMLLEVAYRALTLAEVVVDDRKAMERLGLETKDGARLYVGARGELKTLVEMLGRSLKQAEEIERGEDGAALVGMYRTAFELLDLEEVA